MDQDDENGSDTEGDVIEIHADDVRWRAYPAHLDFMVCTESVYKKQLQAIIDDTPPEE